MGRCQPSYQLNDVVKGTNKFSLDMCYDQSGKI